MSHSICNVDLRNGSTKTKGTLWSGQSVGSSLSAAAVVVVAVRFLLSNSCPSSDVPAQLGKRGMYHPPLKPRQAPCDYTAFTT